MKAKAHCVAAFALLLSGCSSTELSREMDKMGDAEKTFNQRQRDDVLIYMSLETMFPEPKVRELARAAGKGNLEQIERLVKEGVDVNSKGKRNATPLFWAMRNLKGFNKLLDLGADPNVQFQGGGTVMHWVVENKNVEFLTSTIRHGGNVNLVDVEDHNKETPIFSALSFDHDTERLGLLLAAGANVNDRDSFGSTPVNRAAGRGRFMLVYFLLQQGADPSIKDNAGYDLPMEIARTKPLLIKSSYSYQWSLKVESYLDKTSSAKI